VRIGYINGLREVTHTVFSLNCSASVSNSRIDDADSRILYAGSGWQQKASPYLQTADPGIHQSRSVSDTATLRFEGELPLSWEPSFAFSNMYHKVPE